MAAAEFASVDGRMTYRIEQRRLHLHGKQNDRWAWKWTARQLLNRPSGFPRIPRQSLPDWVRNTRLGGANARILFESIDLLS
jgi:hypothetical protein